MVDEMTHLLRAYWSSSRPHADLSAAYGVDEWRVRAGASAPGTDAGRVARDAGDTRRDQCRIEGNGHPGRDDQLDGAADGSQDGGQGRREQLPGKPGIPQEGMMDARELAEVVKLHGCWLRGEDGGRRANLRGAYLQGAYLQGAYLQRADLQRADLQGAKISWSSHALLSEILWRAADTEARQTLAQVGRS